MVVLSIELLDETRKQAFEHCAQALEAHFNHDHTSAQYHLSKAELLAEDIKKNSPIDTPKP